CRVICAKGGTRARRISSGVGRWMRAACLSGVRGASWKRARTFTNSSRWANHQSFQRNASAAFACRAVVAPPRTPPVLVFDVVDVPDGEFGWRYFADSASLLCASCLIAGLGGGGGGGSRWRCDPGSWM